MTKITNKVKNNFTILPNQIISNPNISLKAKGLLAYMLSKPPDWQFYETEITKNSTDGKDSVNTAMQELIFAGYVIRLKTRNTMGQWAGYEYYVYDTPQVHTTVEETTTHDRQQEAFSISRWRQMKRLEEEAKEMLSKNT